MSDKLKPPRGTPFESEEVHVTGRWSDGWWWRKPDRGQHYRTCSYCGSVHPADLADDMANADRTVGDVLNRVLVPSWADMKYGWPHKFYVDIPNRDPSRPFVLSAITFEPEEGERDTWTKVGRKEKRDLRRGGWGGESYTYVQYGTLATHHAKFYSKHLADPAISDDVKEAIFKACGLRFEFLPLGKVRWSPS